MKNGHNILQLAIPLNASANWWRLHSFTSALWLITLMSNDFFPWCSHKPKRERNLS